MQPHITFPIATPQNGHWTSLTRTSPVTRPGVRPGVLDLCLAILVFFLGAKAFTQLGFHSLLWPVAYVLLFGQLILHPRFMIANLRANTLVLAYPLLCLASTLWSETPVVTLRFGIQLSISTLIAVAIGSRFTLRQMLWMINTMFVILFLLSALNYNSTFFQAFDHRHHFVGVFQSKTVLGHAAVIFAGGGAAISILMPQVHWALRVLYAGMLGVVIWMVSISGSATAMAMFGVIFLGTLTAYGVQNSRIVRCLVILTVCISTTFIVFVSTLNAQDPYTFLLNSLGRDPTLTGRTYLWIQGMKVFADNPFLGLGAGSFWYAPDYTNAIIQFQSFYGEGVVSFHNLTVELLVMLGPLGLFAHGLTFAAAVYFTGALSLRYSSVPAIWSCVLILTLYAIAQVSTFYFKPHDFTLILTVALAVSAKRELLRRGATERPLT